ncbi:hypothetical protein PoB_003828500 [Plakobranchus ocellatus]|uniref:Uncharacterized protein n=1 Tax=Plakobranchus ocellatus TaxID=259542 RepID=A0AAV4AX09_9GAST|nr:hypothetical protein PoB_003828500 [Plakobranchus ocellatus]
MTLKSGQQARILIASWTSHVVIDFGSSGWIFAGEAGKRSIFRAWLAAQRDEPRGATFVWTRLALQEYLEAMAPSPFVITEGYKDLLVLGC